MEGGKSKEGGREGGKSKEGGLAEFTYVFVFCSLVRYWT